MRRRRLTAVFLALASSGALAEASRPAAIAPFLPTQPGTSWTYKSPAGMTRTEWLRSIAPEGKLRYEVEERNGPGPSRRFEYEDSVEDNRWVRHSAQGEEVLLTLPLAEGTSWTCGPAQLAVVSTSVKVRVPAGEFGSCLKIRRRWGGEERFQYYAPGVGLVRETLLQDGDETTVLELTEHVVPGEASADSSQQVRREIDALLAAVEDAPVRAGTDDVPMPRRIAGRNLEPTESARKSGVRGPVVAELLVERDGTVSDVRFLRYVPILSVEVLRVVKSWRFEPTLKNGKPVRVLVTMSFSFGQ